ncbi:MAG: hypothetical protein FWH00_01030 [Oscillospiraceae bacterium]|nr:hypothetical protein [Oscillospiraceae bacterium]
MQNNNLIQVMLDKDLVYRLLNGLYTGASGKSLKIVIDTAHRYHVDSKGLMIVIELDEQKKNIGRIDVDNAKQSASVTAGELAEMGLTDLSQKVVTEIKDKYSPSFHSLADNIIVFGRAYGEAINN